MWAQDCAETVGESQLRFRVFQVTDRISGSVDEELVFEAVRAASTRSDLLVREVVDLVVRQLEGLPIVERGVARPQRPMSAEVLSDRSRLSELRSRYSIREIAQMINRSASSVQQACARHGIRPSSSFVGGLRQRRGGE